MIITFPPWHKARSSPAEWNSEYEKLFKTHPFVTKPDDIFNQAVLEDRINAKSGTESYTSKMEEYAGLKHALCYLQQTFCFMAAYLMERTDLEQIWRKGSVEFREKHALIAIAGACGISNNLNYARIYCARELRVSYLANNPDIYLDILRAIAPDDLEKTAVEPQYVSNPEWDRFRAKHKDDPDEIDKLAAGHILILRNKLITHVVHFLTHSILGMPLPEVAVQRNAHSWDKERRKNPAAFVAFETEAIMKSRGKDKDKDRYDELRAGASKARKELKAASVIGCRYCLKMEKSRGGFKKCAVCAKIGREVLYCSKECQVADWKKGHKKICGKALDYDTASNITHIVGPENMKPSIFPPPVPSFKRPLPLLAQIYHLSEHPTCDYAITCTTIDGDKDTMLITFHPDIQSRFREHRDRAIHDGTEACVGLICEYILWHIAVHNIQGITRESVIQQLRAEYACTVEQLEELLAVLARVSAGRLTDKGGPALVYNDCMYTIEGKRYPVIMTSGTAR